MTKNDSRQPMPGFASQGPGRLRATNAKVSDLAGLLQMMVLDRPVIDQTFLEDRYDFTLNWTPDEFQFPAMTQRPAAADSADAPPGLLTAFQEQLGMKLDATKAQADVFVVDKVSRPSEN